MMAGLHNQLIVSSDELLPLCRVAAEFISFHPPCWLRMPGVQVAQEHGFDFMRDQNIPLLMRAVYGSKLPRLLAVLRDPVQRLHSAFYGYPHYFNKVRGGDNIGDGCQVEAGRDQHGRETQNSSTDVNTCFTGVEGLPAPPSRPTLTL